MKPNKTKIYNNDLGAQLLWRKLRASRTFIDSA